MALPLAAKEGITGFLENCRESGIRKDELPAKLEGLEGIGKDELLKVDAEGRCIITDHGHFGKLCYVVHNYISNFSLFSFSISPCACDLESYIWNML